MTLTDTLIVRWLDESHTEMIIIREITPYNVFNDEMIYEMDHI